MTQKEIDIKRNKLRAMQSFLREQLDTLEKEHIELSKIEREINDPHVLIPNSCATLEDWKKDHPFPKFCDKMICMNRFEAKQIQISCNTYQFHYHIVKY